MRCIFVKVVGCIFICNFFYRILDFIWPTKTSRGVVLCLQERTERPTFSLQLNWLNIFKNFFFHFHSKIL